MLAKLKPKLYVYTISLSYFTSELYQTHKYTAHKGDFQCSRDDMEQYRGEEEGDTSVKEDTQQISEAALHH